MASGFRQIQLRNDSGYPISGEYRELIMKHVLGVSWLNGQVEAVHAEGTRVLGTWASPGRVDSTQALAQTLAEACRVTGFRGRSVRIVLDHRSLLFHVQELPPARGKVLHQLLDRQVIQNHFFEEQAAWVSIRIRPAKERQRQLLALIPASVLAGIERACEANDLELTGLFPVASLLAPFLSRGTVPPTEPALIVAELAGTHSLIVGLGNGELLFARSVTDGSESAVERLNQEINRTIHYARQQFGVSVNRVFMLEREGTDAIGQRLNLDGVRVERLPETLAPGLYARWVSAVEGRGLLNLAIRPGESAPWVPMAMAAGLAATLTAAITFSAVTERRIHSRLDQATQQIHQLEQEEARLATQEKRSREFARKTALLQSLPASGQRGIASLFARHVAELMPPAMRITRLEVARGTDGWTVRLDGMSREEGSRFMTGTEAFETALRNGVFKVRIKDSTHRQTLQGTAPAAGNRATGNRSQGAMDPGERAFFLSGVIQ